MGLAQVLRDDVVGGQWNALLAHLCTSFRCLLKCLSNFPVGAQSPALPKPRL